MTLVETKNYHVQLTPTKNSQTQILELKRTTTLSKQPPLYKSKGTQEQTILLPEDDVKRQKHMLNPPQIT